MNDPFSEEPPSPDSPDPREQRRIVDIAVWFEGGLGLAAVFIGWLSGFPALARVQLDPVELGGDLGLALLFTLPLLAFFGIITTLPVGPFRSIRRRLDSVILPLFRELTIFELLLISLMAGFGEEILFRGLLQPVCAYVFGGDVVAGIVASNVIFGLAHWITPTYAVVAGLMGSYMGFVLEYTDNLLAPILLHALYDFVALVLYLRVIHKREN